MQIAEIYESLQGEGMYAGTPSIFVRTSGCNLRCLWCDTPYSSWWPDTKATMSVKTIIKTTDSTIPHVVITGGEPLLQKELGTLTNAFRSRGQIVTIETAGTIYDDSIVPNLWSVSPKLSNSMPTEHPRELQLHKKNNTQHLLPNFLSSDSKIQLKFVIEKNSDIDEVLELIVKYDIPKRTVFLMPQATDFPTLQEISAWLGKCCIHHHLNFSPRLHVELWR